MTSTKQLQANRENAKKSTGPRTEVGKTRSRRNAWKNGLTAETLVISGEDPARFNELRAALLQQYDPQSQLEAELVERIAGLLWRLRRVPYLEAAILEACRAQAEDDTLFQLVRRGDLSASQSELDVGNVLIDGSLADALGTLGRHETTLMNNLTKTLQMLFAVQANRKQRDSERLALEGVAEPANDQ